MRFLIFVSLICAAIACGDEKCRKCPEPTPAPQPQPQPQPQPEPPGGGGIPIPLPPGLPIPLPPGLPIPSPGQPGEPADPAPGSDDQLAELEALINKERADRGIPVVASDRALACAAGAHSADIGPRRTCSHDGSDGSSFSQRVGRCGGSIGYGGEIIACGQSTPRQAVDGWLNSPGHRAIMLDGSQRRVGVGMTGNYWVAVFSGG